MEQPSRIILVNYFRGLSLPHEQELIKLYLAMELDAAFVEECIKEAWELNRKEDTEGNSVFSVSEIEAFKARFYQQQYQLVPLPEITFSKKSKWVNWLTSAAAIILLGSLSLVLFTERNTVATVKLAENKYPDILPGGEKALLTLADGSTISLTEAPKGELSKQGNVQVRKMEDGEIIYKGESRSAVKANMYNTISTPNGGQYAVVLPDGSKAWLNAASSLSYPVSFDQGARKVKMTGEVYFEIAKKLIDQQRVPFYVEAKGQNVEVLGTHFNINAYDDEPQITTTLLEGSVKVTALSDRKSVLLQPGQQALLDDRLVLEKADMEQTMAWKQGDFIFRNEELNRVLRRVARWYDVSIECPNNLGKLRITGMIAQNQPLSAVIKSLSAIGTAKLSVKGRRIVVE